MARLSSIRLSCAAIAGLSTLCVPAAAAPISYLSGASTGTSNPAVLEPAFPAFTDPAPTGFSRDFRQQLEATSNQTWSEGSAPDPTRSETAFARASLATGSLGVRTSFLGNAGGRANASAFIGDTFSFLDGSGSPFQWQTPGEGVRFSMELDGLIGGLPGDVANLSYVVLTVYGQGQRLDDARTPLCAQVAPGVVARSFSWAIGQNYSPLAPKDEGGHAGIPDCADPFVSVLQGNVIGGPTNPTTLVADFVPGGDFAWTLGLRIQGSAGENVPNNWTYAFDNTLTYSFSAPAGVTVVTASGIAPGGNRVPTPGTLALLAMGGIVPVLRAWRSRATTLTRGTV